MAEKQLKRPVVGIQIYQGFLDCLLKTNDGGDKLCKLGEKCYQLSMVIFLHIWYRCVMLYKNKTVANQTLFFKVPSIMCLSILPNSEEEITKG